MRPSLRLSRVRAVVTPTATIAEEASIITATSTINSETRVAHATTRAVKVAAEVVVRVAAGVVAIMTTIGTMAAIKAEGVVDIRVEPVVAIILIITKDAMLEAPVGIIKISSKIFIITLRP